MAPSDTPAPSAAPALSAADAQHIQQTATALVDEVSRVVEGKRPTIELAVTVLLSGGHLLLEDVPGVGKTVLATSLAAAMGAERSRIQFTPDLLPSDVTGASVFDQATTAFEFRPGPVFSHVLLADEINRASPKTQSALLEAMEERQVSVDGRTYPLPDPFVVLATANPIEMDGTFALPEAQRDRFLAQTSLGYPAESAEIRMLAAQSGPPPRSTGTHPDPRGPAAIISARTTPAEVARMIEAIRAVHAADSILTYAVHLARATREHPAVQLGVSPRAVVHLVRAAKARAAQVGRAWVEPQDLQDLIEPVWSHRLHLAPGAYAHGTSALDVLTEVRRQVRIP